MIRACLAMSVLIFSMAGAAAAADPAAECDRLAGAKTDPQKAAPGVVWADIDASAALAACREAVRLTPESLRLGYELARALDKSGQQDEANKAYAAVADKNYPMGGSELGFFYLAGSKGLQQDFVKGAHYLHIGSDGGIADATAALAALYEVGYGLKEDHAKATLLFSRAGERAPDGMNEVAYDMALNHDRLDRALALSRAAVTATPDTSQDKGIYLDTLGWILHLTGADKDAVVALEKAVALEPESQSPVPHDHLGDVYAALGRKADAKAEWTNASSLLPLNGEKDLDRAALATKLKDE